MALSASGATRTTVASARAPLAGRGAGQRRRGVAVEAQAVGEDEAAAAADAPGIADRHVARDLAHGGAAEHDRFDGEQPGRRRDVGGKRALQRRAVEEDGLLRQPVERRAIGDGEGGVDRGVAAAAPVDALGRLAGDRGCGVWPDARPTRRSGRRR